MKYFILAFLLIWAVPSTAHHHNQPIIINVDYPALTTPPVPTSDTIINETTIVNNDLLDDIMAMSAAGDSCVFDYAKGWQGCISGGWYGSSTALNGSLVTRIDTFMLRVNIQADTEFDEVAGGVGGSWHF